MITTIRAYAGEACLRAAAYLARTGRSLHRISDVTVESAPEGSRVVTLSVEVPRVVHGLRLELDDSMEIVRVEAVRGRQARIDRPLAHTYPRGAAARLLM